MVKLIIGLKGTGKTKTLIEMANKAIDSSKGSIVCLEKGDKLRFDIKYQARLIDTSEYGIEDAHALYGFVAGIYASDHDTTHIFIDSAIKMCGGDVNSLSEFVRKAAEFSEKTDVSVVVTSSVTEDQLPDDIKKFL